MDEGICITSLLISQTHTIMNAVQTLLETNETLPHLTSMEAELVRLQEKMRELRSNCQFDLLEEVVREVDRLQRVIQLGKLSTT